MPTTFEQRSASAKKGAFTKKLNAFIKEWVKALRSEDFKQATGYMCTIEDDGPHHCCLGVGAEVGIKMGLLSPDVKGDVETNSTMGVVTKNIVRYSNNRYNLSENIRKALGIRDAHGAFEYKNGRTARLDELNDGGKSFKQIANIIERRPKGLFVQ